MMFEISSILRPWVAGNDLVPTSYGRTALYLALMAVDVRRKEVLLPALTCATTLTPAILQAGGIPVFVDISKENLNLHPISLKEKLSPRSRVVISHHYYGSAASNINEVQKFAARNDLIHIEDCTHSLGADCGSNHVGDIGDAAVFSFSKLLNCPGGGAVTFKNRALYDRALELQRKWASPWHDFITNAQALKYELELGEDRPGSTRLANRIKGNALIDLARRLFIKVLCDGSFYRRSYFRVMSRGDLGMFHPGLDTRMTELQYSRISQMLLSFERITGERRRKAKLLNSVLPAYFQDFESDVLMQYVTKPFQLEVTDGLLKRLGVRTRRLWPYSQPYWPEQLTDQVKSVRDELLLLDIDSVTDEVVEALQGKTRSIPPTSAAASHKRTFQATSSEMASGFPN
jgi:dTDP-4-amino-4,6-dideoxygalactose transaminase